MVSRTATGAVIGWRAANRGDAPIAGYRVSLDGAVAGQTRSLRYTLMLSSSHSHRVTVTAVDTRDRLGASSGALVIRRTGKAQSRAHRRPCPKASAPSEIGGTEATILWLPSRRGAAPLSGYRVYRDGTLVGQTPSTTLRLTHLAFPQTYVITVAAVDTDGAESAPSWAAQTDDRAPRPDAPSLLSATSVTDTSATLSWQAGTAAEGTVSGYLLYKNGEPEGFVAGQIVTVSLASARLYTFTVRTRDSDGYLSAPRPRTCRGVPRTRRPRTPQGRRRRRRHQQLGPDQLAAEHGRERQHRRLPGVPQRHPGRPGGEHRTDAEELAAGSEYSITVSAVDSMGAISEPSQPLTVATADPPPTHGNVQAFLLAIHR